MAKDFAERYLGVQDDITVNLSKRYEKAVSEINPKLDKIKDLEHRKEKTRADHQSLNKNNRRRIMSSTPYSGKPQVPGSRKSTSILQKTQGFKRPADLIGVA